MASTKSESIYAPLETAVPTDEVQVAEVIGMPSVQVQAPSDLPEGYQFRVEIKGKATIVAVVRIVRFAFAFTFTFEECTYVVLLERMARWHGYHPLPCVICPDPLLKRAEGLRSKPQRVSVNYYCAVRACVLRNNLLSHPVYNYLCSPQAESRRVKALRRQLSVKKVPMDRGQNTMPP
jgi:hypothetical protein